MVHFLKDIQAVLRRWFAPATNVLFVLLVGNAAVVIPMHAQDTVKPENCLPDATVSFSVNPTVITLGQSVTISWTASTPCGGFAAYITDLGTVGTPKSGQATVIPVESKDYTMTLTQFGVTMEAARVHVTVNPPAPAYGRTTFSITSPGQQAYFVQGIATTNADVVLADDLELDMSGWAYLHIAPGVHILGGRSSTKLGPRIFTTSKPHQLFTINYSDGADGVVISGVRIDGLERGVSSDDPDCTGIAVYSCVNVEIGNCELYGWSGSAVIIQEKDGDGVDRIGMKNPTAVWVHDNYIHHNRHWSENGYGVASTHGAHTLIERNVFDYNRHAIMGGGDPGSGYRAYNNLVLPNGGQEFNYLAGVFYTHEFDVHGTLQGGADEFFRGYYAGPAGEYFEYKDNTILYVGSHNALDSGGDALKVRGYPSIGAYVYHNVFTHGQGGAITQTDGNNLYQGDNQFGVNPLDQIYPETFSGDFDGDGISDVVMASGVNWWCFSGATQQWRYLNTTSKKTADILEVRDYNGDGRSDVKVTGTNPGDAPVIYSGGGPKQLLTATIPSGVATVPKVANVYWQAPGSSALHLVILRNGAVISTNDHVNFAFAAFMGAGDFNGDGVPDLMFRDPGAAPIPGSSFVWKFLLDASGGPLPSFTGVDYNTEHLRGTVADSTQVAGIGDFNGDGRDDVLLRHADGQVEVWFGGDPGNSALVNLHNGSIGPEPAPLDWQLAGVGDFNGDGFRDIYWLDSGGSAHIWYMQRGMVVGEQTIYGSDPSHEYKVVGVGDFDGDGRSDVLFRSTLTGRLAMWFGNNSYGNPTYRNISGLNAGLDWAVLAVGDFNGDGLADILWRSNVTGETSVWGMNGSQFLSESGGVVAKVTLNPIGNRSDYLGAPVSGQGTGTYGTLPYSWSATGLPLGVTLGSTTGAFTGTPTQPGIFKVMVTLTDHNGFTSTGTFQWTVLDFSVNTEKNRTNYVGDTVTGQATLANAIYPPYTWTVTGLPPGISFNAVNAVYSGTLTQEGTFTVVFTATDKNGHHNSGSLLWGIGGGILPQPDSN